MRLRSVLCVLFFFVISLSILSRAQQSVPYSVMVWQSGLQESHLENAIGAPDLSPLDEEAFFIDSTSVDYWFIVKTEESSPVIFTTSKPIGVSLVLYLYENGKVVESNEVNASTSSSPFIAIERPESQQVAVKLTSRAKTKITFSVVPQNVFIDQNNIRIAWNGLQAGLVAMIALIMVGFATVRKGERTIYGAIYFVGVALLSMSLTGISEVLIGPLPAQVVSDNNSFWLIIALFSSVSYYRLTYQVRDFEPTIDAFIQGLRIVFVFLAFLELWKGVPITLLFLSLTVTLVLNLGLVIRFSKKTSIKKVVLMAWLTLTGLVCYWIASQLTNSMPYRLVNVTQIAITVHVILLCAAMLLREIQRQKTFVYYSLHDDETGSPNKNFLFRVLRQKMEENKEHSLLLFKAFVVEQTRINFGMDYAQKHLKILISKLNEQLSVLSKSPIEVTDSGPSYLFRLEDSVFAILIEGKLELSTIEQFVCLLSSVFEEGVKYKGVQLVDQLEVGVANYPMHATSPDQLVQRALQAMSVKTMSADRWHIFDVANSVISERKLKISAALRDAVESEQFELYLQPQVCLKTGQVYGAEALLRWHHPILGQIPPDQFIPIAESSGIIHSLTEWVVEKGLTYQKVLSEVYPEHVLSLNISGKDLARRELPVHLITLLTQLDLSPSKITLEITESATIGNMNTIRGVFEDYRQIGVKMAIDDFGTGYSSLAYLTQLGFDELKIDKQFVMNMENIPSNQTICNATCDMSHSLGSSVVAEGVESQTAYLLLKKYGCDYGQGYYIARPMPFDEYVQWLVESIASCAATSNLSG
ncbi:GGDEF domain-containing phosphodiesterase [Pseudoalteromonas xiamenensis]|uniref:putative bifunctional diguanylate cyclase/phosphodiesterase n=1 Tax=Pseudoalteromonas xiamenensis TaxID=882626 RepID=UPI0027E4D30A|nr:GGDEF domain-containing phosphodiesterase [Pseudoalteromonas xiamenensis]WMN60189.1 GGDEF domain-containing phosphodiesterase [Pseudoalteromonas xiamenensis]